MRSTSVIVFVLLSLAAVASPPRAAAQNAETTPAFSIATSHVFNSKEHPSITLTHRRVDHLDFRVYRVNDAFAFFEKLRDAHTLGSEEPVVPQEQTWLERIAAWKASRRSDLRSFVRRQFSPEYRHQRSVRADAEQVVLRRTLNANSFAQVPLLNASQLVTSWRELLPLVREAEYRRVPLDLPGPGIYVVEAVNPPLRAYTVVIVSDVGLVTKTAPGELVVFAANRFSGTPIAGCRIRVLADQQPVGNGTTAADGTLALPVQAKEPDDLVTLADCGGQTAATDPGAFTLREPTRELVGYTYTDRPVYRPGHTVHYRSILRWRERGALVAIGAQPIEVAIVDEQDKVLQRESKRPDDFGTIDGTFPLPATAALGFYTIRVTGGDRTATGSFEVQEYRKPEFDVAVRAANRFERQGGRASVTVTARYYFGQPVSGGTVKYVLHRQPYFSPLRFEASGEEDFGDQYFGDGGDAVVEGTARLDDRGTAEIVIPLEADEENRDYTARVEAQVVDASGRDVSGSTSIVATVGRFLLIASADRYVHNPAENVSIRVRALDYEGAPQPNTRIHATLERYEYRNGYADPAITTVQQGDIVADAEGRAVWTLTAPREPGDYRVRVGASSEGRLVSDTTSFWIPGRQEFTDEGDRFLELMADRRTYQPGDTAQIVIQGEPFDTSVLVTKESQHVSYHEVVRAAAGTAIDVPISPEDIGDTYVSIAFLKDDRLFRAERRLSVPAASRQLTISADTDRPIARPGEPASFTLHVADQSGQPVRAQLSVGLVDEALYGVRPDTTPDPLRFFYRREYNEVSTAFSRDYPFVGYSGTEQLLLAARRRPFTLADFKADRPDRPRVRKDFPDTVFWSAQVTTDASGTARVNVTYPDSLTSWRLTVRAVTAGTEVGTVTTRTTTTKDLILRVVTPRFLTEGDRVTVPAIVHNYLPAQKSVSVTLTTDGLSSPGTADGTTRSMQVAENGQQRTDWAFAATAVRPVTITGKATTDAAGDAMAVTLPVNPAGLQRDDGTSGSLTSSDSRTIDLSVPATANGSGASVRVALAPSLAGAMLSALDYLSSYPWGCTEQTLSSFVPNLVVLRALDDMQIAPTERLQSLDRRVADGLKRLYDYQHDDGGWGWWKTDQNDPFMTAYAVDGLVQARDHGVRVEAWRITRGAEALMTLWTKYPRAVPDLKAYEAYVLARAEADGFNVNAALDELWDARSRMEPTGHAFLLMTLDARKDPRGDTLASELIASAKVQGDLASWTATSDPLLGDFGDTSAEATALALAALSQRGSTDATLERAARWLMANRTAGAYWVSTKQTALALEGLLAFMQARGEKPAAVTADVLVNGTRVGTARFDAAALTSPNPVLIEAPATVGTNTVQIVRHGEGALYFDAAVRYYDKPAAASRTGSRSLAILREYAALTPVQVKGRMVYRETPVPQTLRAGDLLLVRLTVAGSADWRYLMIEDPIPAGTEAIEDAASYELERRLAWDFGSQRELRDDRTVYFLNRLARGRREFAYMLKVTTPGTFSAMPAHVVPMYVPGVSASSDPMTFTISAEGVQ